MPWVLLFLGGLRVFYVPNAPSGKMRVVLFKSKRLQKANTSLRRSHILKSRAKSPVRLFGRCSFPISRRQKAGRSLSGFSQKDNGNQSIGNGKMPKKLTNYPVFLQCAHNIYWVCENCPAWVKVGRAFLILRMITAGRQTVLDGKRRKGLWNICWTPPICFTCCYW